MKPTRKTTWIVAALLATASSAAAMQAPAFSTLDTNADGQVSFDEYAAYASTDGKSRTLAAQEFTRLSQGDAVLTEDEYIFVDILAEQPYAFQSTPAAVVETPVLFDTAVAGEVTYSDTLDPAEQPIPAEEGENDLPELREPIAPSAPVEAPIEMDAPEEMLEPLDPIEPEESTEPMEPMPLEVEPDL